MRVQVTRPKVSRKGSRWRVRWTAFGKQRERVFDTQRVANRFAATVDDGIDRGLVFDESTGEVREEKTFTVGELSAEYLARLREAGASATTMHAREAQVRKIGEVLGVNENVTDVLTRANLSLVDREMYRGITNRAPRRAALLQMAELAFDLELMPSFKLPSAPRRKRKDLYTPDWHWLFEQVQQNCVGVSREIFLLMLLTGVRPGEACALQQADVSDAGDLWQFDIRKSLTAAQVYEFAGQTGPTKTRRDRVVFAPKELWSPPDNYPWLFPGRANGEPYHQTSLNSAWKRAGLEGVPYTCRHVYHTFALANGVPVGDLAVLTGNSAETIFRFYVGSQGEPVDTASTISDAMVG